MEAAKKKQILEEKYQIKMTRELEEAMDFLEISEK